MSHFVWTFLLLSVVSVKGKTIFITIPPEYVTGIVTSSIDCIQKTGVSPDVLQQLIDWNFKESNKIKHFVYCLGTTSGFVDSTGHIKMDMMMKLVGNNPRKNEIADTLNECNKLEGKNKYDTLYKGLVCFHDKTPIYFRL